MSPYQSPCPIHLDFLIRLELGLNARQVFIPILVVVVLTKTLRYKQVRLAELLEQEGADIIQTEGGKCSHPSKSGVLGLIEKVGCRIYWRYKIYHAASKFTMFEDDFVAVFSQKKKR